MPGLRALGSTSCITKGTNPIPGNFQPKQCFPLDLQCSTPSLASQVRARGTPAQGPGTGHSAEQREGHISPENCWRPQGWRSGTAPGPPVCSPSRGFSATRPKAGHSCALVRTKVASRVRALLPGARGPPRHCALLPRWGSVPATSCLVRKQVVQEPVTSKSTPSLSLSHPSWPSLLVQRID